MASAHPGTAAVAAAPIVDDKSPICIPFILERLAQHRTDCPAKPFIIGLNGVQGVGKTTLVRALASTLRDQEGLHTLVVSIDDFYLRHEDQRALAASHPDNLLVSCRGEPGKETFSSTELPASHLIIHLQFIFICAGPASFPAPPAVFV